ncbi:MAG: glycosyltransferase [Acidobacteriota bacterium]
MNRFPPGFEADHDLRSEFIRKITLLQLDDASTATSHLDARAPSIPRRLVRFWHDASNVPADVRACLDTWNRLADEGFEFLMFDDESAGAYIESNYGVRERSAFARCEHPAMRCDYFRMCFLLEEGGFYVDADDVLLEDSSSRLNRLFNDPRMKIQPLGFNLSAGVMLKSQDLWRPELETENRVFYVANDPIIVPAGHPLLRRALRDATEKLLDDDEVPDIQHMTGPGNLTAALAAYARELLLAGSPPDFELIRDWDSIAEVHWDLAYRRDARNWRSVYPC